MLKLESIKMTDSKGNEYLIMKNQVESFPLVGGESANWIETESWNQHGNTPIDALMQVYDGELVFIIRTAFMIPEEIIKERRKIIDVCNPLNGTVKMTVTLNDGSVFNRDITFTSAPIFPIGLENRNREWQKVQLLYTANNPFWYAEEEITESFQGVEPLFHFPFTFGGRLFFYNQKSGFDYKVRGSVIENPNSAYSFIQPALPTSVASLTTTTELLQTDYDVLDELGNNTNLKTSVSGNRPIYIFKYDVLAILEKKFSATIWNGATALADKLVIARNVLDQLNFHVVALGSINNGQSNILHMQVIKKGWVYSELTDYDNSTYENDFVRTTDVANGVHDDGFAYVSVYMDASNGTEYSLRILEAFINLDVSLDENGESIIFGNVIPSNIAINQGQVEAPVVIEIKGTCVNPRIENETTGEFILFKDLSMNADQTLVIDTTFGQKKVELDGVNVFNKLDFSSTFFNLQKGENLIDFSDETGSTQTTIHFIYRNLYITI